jgi:hypothetical protein
LHAEVIGVPVSVLRYSYPLLEATERLDGFALPLASVADLRRGAVSLTVALDSYRAKYPVEDVGHVVRSLVYSADAEAEPLPNGLTLDHWNHIRHAFLERVRALEWTTGLRLPPASRHDRAVPSSARADSPS